MFLNCTYVNIISFSDHLVTFKFEGISILRLTGIFSGNFIIFENLCGLIRIDLFYPFQRILCGSSFDWFPTVSLEVLITSPDAAEPPQSCLKRAKQIYSDQST